MASSLFPVTRWSLIGRIDDQHALTLLIEHYADSVARYLGRKFPTLQRRGDIDDLVQEVLLALMRSGDVLQRAQPSNGGRFRYFLMRVAYNAARNAQRRLMRSDWSLLVDEAVAHEIECDHSSLPDADMDRAWAASILQQAWTDVRAWAASKHIDQEGVALLERHILHGQTLRDAAAEMGLTLGTAHRRLAKARSHLQQAVIDHLHFTNELKDLDDAQAYQFLIEAAAR